MTSPIDRILGQLKESEELVTEKTAEADSPTLDQQMLDKVREVSESTAKTATADKETKPAEELEKMASDAAKAEDERIKKEAETMGAYVADGFMSRIATYDKALENAPVKTASKDQLKEATETGRAKGREEVEKEASEAYEQGYNDQLAEVHKFAAHVHLCGQNAAAELVKAAAEQENK